MKKKSLAFKMSVALVLGIIAGTLAIIARENVSADTWQLINKLLFADISQSGNENALGLFYIIGQLFIKSLQLIIVPMVFTSITLAMVKISDAKKLGRISTKTVLTFLTTSVVALIMAGIVGSVISYSGLFGSLSVEGLSASTGSTSSNPLLILLNAVPSNVVSAFSNNSGVLAVVFMAVVVGLAINNLGDKVTQFTKLCGEVSSIVTVALSYIVNTFGPLAIFALITRTFAAYGIEYLKPAFIYMLVTTILLLIYLVFGYSTFIALLAKLNPIPFVKKIVKVALFG
ncbi:MAG: cation:dicarboxylase symporter family transporter, partial [Erysipelotrichaceae bacterium]|nr:cation:dicarboxylase symporter family transporter [Erysipelotrichaceae bacterium]